MKREGFIPAAFSALLLMACSSRYVATNEFRYSTDKGAFHAGNGTSAGNARVRPALTFSESRGETQKMENATTAFASLEEMAAANPGDGALLAASEGNKTNYEWGTERYSPERLLAKAITLKDFAEENGYNPTIAFLIDMQVKSGKKRFFVCDLEQLKILGSGLVAHGSGGRSYSYSKTFSNLPGSNCTSLGIYKVGEKYNGSFGTAFRLYGLNASNSNAYRRFVVIHAMGCIPDQEINGLLCQTEGCPAVSPLFLAYLQEVLAKSEKPVLMWIFR